MATLTITIPETAEITAAEFVEAAACGYGWDPAQGITAEEMLLDQLEHDLHHRFRSGATHLSREAVEAALPIPESRGLRVHREREEAAEVERESARAAAEAAGGRP